MSAQKKVGNQALLEVEETMPIPARLEDKEDKPQEGDKEKKVSEDKCKVKGHKKQTLIFVCTAVGCDHILLCKRCKRKHEKEHLPFVKLMDEWFNNMFGRKVADSDNNKVSRKCGMNLGKLQELLKELQASIDERKETIQAQTEQFLGRVTKYIEKKKQECLNRLESDFHEKSKHLDGQNATYKKLKSLNRFTILENLKRQHDPNGLTPPKIPIDSIIRFLLANESQLSDSQQIENQHKEFSKLMRDTESLEQQIRNDQKVFTSLKTSEEGQPDYLAKDTPITHRIEDYIDFLFAFEKGLPKKTQNFFRSGTLSMEEDEPFSQGSSSNISFSNQQNKISFKSVSSRMQSFQPKQEKPQKLRRRLTIEEVLQHSQQPQQPQQQVQFNVPTPSSMTTSLKLFSQQQTQNNYLNHLQDQDKGEFFKLKRLELKNNHEEEQEELDYECETQENFNSAQFIDFTKDSIRVFSDQLVQLYSLKSSSFNKKDNLLAQQKILVKDQEMYEVGAIEEVPFFANLDLIDDLLQKSINRIEEDIFKQQDCFHNQGSHQAFPSSNHFSNSTSPPDSPELKDKQKQPLLIIGLKSDPAKIEIWDMNSNEKVCEQPSAHDCSITCIKVLELKHQQSVLFAVGSYDGLIKIWQFEKIASESSFDLLQSKCNYSLTPKQTLRGHKDFVTCMILFMLKDDPLKNYLVSSGSDKKIILWDWKSDEKSSNGECQEIKDGVNKGQNEDNKVHSAEVNEKEKTGGDEKKQESKPKPFFLKKQVKIMSMKPNSFSSTSSCSTASSNSDNTSQTLKTTEKKPLKIMDNVHSDKINCFEILEEGLLASGSSDNTIKIWDMDIQKEQKSLQNKFIVNNICRLRRGQLVCSANNVKMSIYLVNIWNWEKGQIVGVIKGHTGRITKLHVLPDYQSLTKSTFSIITCERNKVIRIWKDSKAKEEEEEHNITYYDEDCTPTSQRSFSNRGMFNPAEEFFHNYHIELDPSLTPKYINMQRIGSSQTKIPLGGYDKTPIHNLIKGQCFSSLITQNSQQQPIFFPSQIIQHPNSSTFSESYSINQQLGGILPANSSLLVESGNLDSIGEVLINNSINSASSPNSQFQLSLLQALNSQMGSQCHSSSSSQQQLQQQQQPSNWGKSPLNQADIMNQQLKKKNYQEIASLLSPLEEANESCNNSPMGSFNEVQQDIQVLNTSIFSNFHSTSIENLDNLNNSSIYQQKKNIFHQQENEDDKKEDIPPPPKIENRILRNGFLTKSKAIKLSNKTIVSLTDSDKIAINKETETLKEHNQQFPSSSSSLSPKSNQAQNCKLENLSQQLDSSIPPKLLIAQDLKIIHFKNEIENFEKCILSQAQNHEIVNQEAPQIQDEHKKTKQFILQSISTGTATTQDEQTNISFYNSATAEKPLEDSKSLSTPPSIISTNPLLLKRGAIQKSSKSSRNIFNN